MNERIKELTINALVQCDATKMTPLSSSVDNGSGVDIPLEFAEKFAELIVRECANWIESQDEAEHPTAWLLCDELKQHFGVEE